MKRNSLSKAPKTFKECQFMDPEIAPFWRLPVPEIFVSGTINLQDCKISGHINCQNGAI
jgi:hypothetical protein